MCNIDRGAEAQILTMGLNLITKAIEASVKENNHIQSTDVLATATTAYQQGKITKSQFMAVINALDEQASSTKAHDQPSWISEYIEANHYLNQYR
ncbi:MAG: hypothetical protein KME09_14800 [Pleurocapsa minor HA4230-MV1]|jgi:hypothetical protein|nr:hypothetical protein [Pleurocapsa minor HA4230-MV1]